MIQTQPDFAALYGMATCLRTCRCKLQPFTMTSLQRHAKTMTMTIAIVIEDLHFLPSQENKTTGSSNAEVNSDVASFSEPSFVQDRQVMRCGDA